MIILSNALSDKADEGSLNVASALVKRLKKADETITVVSYDRKSKISDIHIKINKLMLSSALIRLIESKKEPVLYIPFPAKSYATALRIFILSRFQKNGLKVLSVMNDKTDCISKFLLKISKAEFILLSEKAEKFYRSFLPYERVKYIKTGVDTRKFYPVNNDVAAKLKKKYGFEPDVPLVLHVGHMAKGRNIAELMKIDPKYQILLVTSTLTKDISDEELKRSLSKCENIRIIQEYMQHIEELYQMSDVYFFPVEESGNCIDAPLSCLEAAACGKPIVTTAYGEMTAFRGVSGFYFISDTANPNELIKVALNDSNYDTRAAVLPYDWDNAVTILQNTAL